MGDRRAWEHNPVEQGRGCFPCPVSKSADSFTPRTAKKSEKEREAYMGLRGGNHRQDGDLRIPVIPEMTLRASVGGLDEKSQQTWIF